MQLQLQKQAITQQQSQLLIHELISVSINCITFLRNIFNDNNYIDTKYYGDKDSQTNYIRTKKLIFGVSELGDKMIKYIDEGIKDAILKEYLKAIQFSIQTFKGESSNVVESYVFGIDYKNKQINLSNNNSSKFTTTFTEDDDLDYNTILSKIQNLIRKLILLTQSFNNLPKKKEISIRLLFNDSCPKDYQPPYFQDASDLPPNLIKIDDEEEDENENINDLGSVKTGKHDINLRVFVESKKSNEINQKTIDPFTLFINDDEYDFDVNQLEPLDDIPPSSLRLDSYMNSNNDQETGLTQKLTNITTNSTTSNSLNCKKCLKELNYIEYGYDEPTNRSILCFNCLIPENNIYLKILMKIRLFWDYFLKNEIQIDDELMKFFKLDLVHDLEIIKGIFNWFFKNSILITTNETHIKINSSSYVKGCGTIVPMIEGLKNQIGNELKKGNLYNISFIPILKLEYPFYSYDSNIDKLIYPNYKVLKPNFVRNQINKIKSSLEEFNEFSQSNTIIPDSQPLSGILSSKFQNKRIKPIIEVSEPSDNDEDNNEEDNEEDEDENDITKNENEPFSLPYDGTSFADSIDYLSQGTSKLSNDTPKKRINENIIDKRESIKRRKISVNV
ncbi:uncharacterized protein KGF55_000458 [Candida pseudojiufengensis]|uniref:uncharacterized protein n=1 Tax=Candida pseudojiufengensis TaxID=497109 RepID=UPI002224C2BD|nr:uncharacterized protein KGF55_000458 [Candida pseudojiufengensis]KAI5966149.1 hypothetical protein KGF55_000458 [Candida pseudojiufengensis]